MNNNLTQPTTAFTENKRYIVYLSTEKNLDNDLIESLQTNSFYFAKRNAIKMSKRYHPKTPKRILTIVKKGKKSYSEYKYVSEIFDTVQNKIIADYADGVPNYIETEPKILDPKYYIPHQFIGSFLETKSIALYYNEIIGATNDLIEILKLSISKYINIEKLQLLIDKYMEIEFYNEAIEFFKEWKQKNCNINIPTIKAAMEATKIIYKKPSNIKVVHISDLMLFGS